MNNFLRVLALSASVFVASCSGGGTSSSPSTTTTIGGGTSVAPPPVVEAPQNVSEGAVDFPSSLSTLGLLAPNGSVTGTIDRPSDIDGFRFVISERQTVRLSLNGITLQEVSLFVEDEQGSPVSIGTQAFGVVDGQLVALNPSSSTGVELTLNPATYLVAVTAPLGSDETGTYELSSSVVSTGGPDPDDLTVTGTISKGIVANAPVAFYAVILDGPDTVVTLGETTTDSEGRYEAVISREMAGDAFYVASTLSGATTTCDAPLGCGETAFGDQFTYADDGFEPESISLTPLETLRNGNVLAAPVATPTTAASVNQNVNLFTTMIFANIDIEQDSFASSFAVVSVAQLQAISRVTELFGIGGVGNIDIPFVDITQPIVETDSDAVKAAILAGGMQAVMAEGVPDQVYAAFIRDLFNNSGNFLIRESSPTSATVSLEDIYVAALDIEDVNMSTSNAYAVALQSIRDDLTNIQAAEADSRTIDGQIP